MGKLTMDTIETPDKPAEGDSTLYFDETSKTLKSIDDDGDVTEYLSSVTDSNFPAQNVHVATNGSDTTGIGTIDRPYATIKHAISSITDATTSKRYAVMVAAGLYVEDNPITCKDYVNTVGISSSTTIIVAQNSTSNLFDIATNSSFVNLGAIGPDSAVTYSVTGSNLFTLLRSSVVSNGTIVKLNTTSAEILLSECSLRTCGIGIESIGEDNIGISSVQFLGCDADISISNTDTIITTSNCRITRDKITLPDQFTNFFGTFSDSKTNDESFNVYSELGVGRPEQGRECCLGEGDSYTRGMLVYTYNSSSTAYVDVTDDLVEPNDGNTVSYPALTPDNALYVCTTLKDKTGSLIRHLGQKMKVDTAQIGGEIVLEYYNGSAWVEFNSMGVNSSDNYISYGKDYLQTLGSHQVRFDDSVGTDWIANDPMTIGNDYYWIRFRINTTLTLGPVFDQIKIHSNRTEINEDGYLEYFGKARPVNVLPIIYGSLRAVTTTPSTSPANQDLFVSDNLAAGLAENDFQNGSDDRTGLAFYVPLDIDTSSPIRFRVSYIGTSPGTDTIDWQIRWGHTAEGDSVYRSTTSAPTTGPNEQLINRSTAMPANDDELQSEIFELDVSDIISERPNSVSGDILWIAIQRDGSTDSYSGDVIMVSISPFYTKWRDGGHINNWN